MATDKKSFISYLDWGATFDELDDAEAGKLVKLIFDYVRDKNPEPTEKLIRVAFEHIKQDLKRDLKKWEGYIEKQRVNGKSGGRPEKPKETQKTQAFFEKPKKADNVNVFVNVNDNVNELNEMEIGKTVEYCSITLNRKYSTDRIRELWKAFTIQNEDHLNRKDKVRHFRNWIKIQPFEEPKQSSIKKTVEAIKHEQLQQNTTPGY